MDNPLLGGLLENVYNILLTSKFVLKNKLCFWLNIFLIQKKLKNLLEISSDKRSSMRSKRRISFQFLNPPPNFEVLGLPSSW